MSKQIVFDMRKIFASSVSAVLPDHLIRRSVKYNHSSQQLIIGGEHFCLRNKNVHLVGSGKAVQNMAKEVERILNGKIKHGIISIPDGTLSSKSKNENIFYYEGALNNLPDANAVITAKAIRDHVMNLGCDDLLLVLLSGGGSALMPLPKPPINLDEKINLIKQLANSGAEIKELNTVRKRISDLKGGQLAIKAQPAQVICLLLSDIVGDPIDFLASGPTTENTDKPSDAVDIISKYNLMDQLPESIKNVLSDNSVKDQFPHDNVRNYIIGSNKIAIAAASEEAKKLNYLSFPLSNEVTGNVKEVASEYVKLTQHLCDYLSGKINLENLSLCVKACNIPGIHEKKLGNLTPKDKNLCLILGGEITVNVKGSGKGGRNQQLALEFSECIHNNKDNFKNFNVHFLSAGTDGIDGPTDAAGAIGHLNLISDAKQKNIDYQKYLCENDSYNFYRNHFDGQYHVITGHTNTNVMDIHIIVITRETKDQ
ncbi:glycerate kinase [Spodoptera litura]|uniref:Glycerate kinase n=1 Tax=Spodoptera litura TaxID=69820 RepID=A0A9J7EB14_SPOLT|nr:glycerate kinase [Spodoptera litura]